MNLTGFRAQANLERMSKTAKRIEDDLIRVIKGLTTEEQRELLRRISNTPIERLEEKDND